MGKHEVKQAAVQMIKEEGLINLSRAGLCERVGIPDGSFPHVVGSSFTEFIKELQALNLPSPSGVIVSKTRTNPELRKSHILDRAVALAKKAGYLNLTREAVAECAGVSGSLVSQYFTMPALREAVMETAVMKSIPEIIAQGIVNQNIVAMAAPVKLRRQAAKLLEV